MRKYRVQMVTRTLLVFRVEAEDRLAAAAIADSWLPRVLPKDSDTSVVLGILDDSEKTVEDDGKSILEIAEEMIED